MTSSIARLRRRLLERGVRLVCLAGFMRLVGAPLLDAFPNAILNIHPSLLPAFPGVDAQRQALEHGVCFSGATVHLVTRELDAGPIVLQASCPSAPTTRAETLSASILVEEHRLYPAAVQLMLDGGWTLSGRRFVPLTRGPAPAGRARGCGSRRSPRDWRRRNASSNITRRSISAE